MQIAVKNANEFAEKFTHYLAVKMVFFWYIFESGYWTIMLKWKYQLFN